MALNKTRNFVTTYLLFIYINFQYKEIKIGKGKPAYLRNEYLDNVKDGDEIRALIKIRCGNMEESNKYWIEENKKLCWFCGLGLDNLEHYIVECRITREWFKNLDINGKDRIDKLWNEELNKVKGKILKKVWFEKEKKKEEKKKTTMMINR